MKRDLLEIEKILHDLDNEEACIVEIKVSTDSMQPLINAQEKQAFLLIHRKPKIGDIILYRIEDKLYCHRIIAEVSGGYITKGDNCLFPDKVTINQNNILGFLVFQSARKKIMNMVQLLKMYIYSKYPVFIFYNYHKKRGAYIKYLLSRFCMFQYK